MSRKSITIMAVFLAAVIITAACIILPERQRQLTVGIFAGSNWGVQNDNSYQLIDNAIARFEELHPDIRVTYQSGILRRDYGEWLADNLLENDAPDVFLVPSENFMTLASVGALMRLDGLADRDESFDPGVFYSAALGAGQYDGRLYALPYETDPKLMFVNKSLLAGEGIAMPDNDWHCYDFYQICQQVTCDTDGDGALDQFGSYGFGWQEAVFASHAELFDQNGTMAYFTSDTVTDAISFAKNINRLNQNYSVTAEDYDNGKVAFRPFSFSAYRARKPYSYNAESYTRFEWDCLRLPALRDGYSSTELDTLLYAVNAKTHQRDAAWEFIKFLTTDAETQLDIFRYSHGASPVADITASAEAAQIVDSYMSAGSGGINMQEVNEVLQGAMSPRKFPLYQSAIDMADTQLYHVVHGEKNVQSVLLELQREILDLLKK